ncbi:NERD domain-containing protein [Nocardia sp. NPDC001965]
MRWNRSNLPLVCAALGASFEKLVGRHLALLGPAGAVVFPHITDGPEKARKKTVDHIVVLPDVVLVVEAKVCGPPLGHGSAMRRRWRISPDGSELPATRSM